MTERDRQAGRLLLQRGLCSREVLQQAAAALEARLQVGQQVDLLVVLVEQQALAPDVARGLRAEVGGGAPAGGPAQALAAFDPTARTTLLAPGAAARATGQRAAYAPADLEVDGARAPSLMASGLAASGRGSPPASSFFAAHASFAGPASGFFPEAGGGARADVATFDAPLPPPDFSGDFGPAPDFGPEPGAQPASIGPGPADAMALSWGPPPAPGQGAAFGAPPAFGPTPGFDPGPGFGPTPGFDPGPGFGPGPAFGPGPGLGPGPAFGPTPGFDPGPGFGPTPGFDPGPGFGPGPAFGPGPGFGQPQGFDPGPGFGHAPQGPPGQSGFATGPSQPFGPGAASVPPGAAPGGPGASAAAPIDAAPPGRSTSGKLKAASLRSGQSTRVGRPRAPGGAAADAKASPVLAIAAAGVAVLGIVVALVVAFGRGGDPATDPASDGPATQGAATTPGGDAAPTTAPTATPPGPQGDPKDPFVQAKLSPNPAKPADRAKLDELSEQYAEVLLIRAWDLAYEEQRFGDAVATLERFPLALQEGKGYQEVKAKLATYNRFAGFARKLEQALAEGPTSKELRRLVARAEGNRLEDDLRDLECVERFKERARRLLGDAVYDELAVSSIDLEDLQGDAPGE